MMSVMAFYCRHGHEQTAKIHRPERRGWQTCGRCFTDSKRRARAKEIAAGKMVGVRPLTGVELRSLASRLAHGETISGITIGTKKTHKTALYHLWMVWRHLHPEVAKRSRRRAPAISAAPTPHQIERPWGLSQYGAQQGWRRLAGMRQSYARIAPIKPPTPRMLITLFVL